MPGVADEQTRGCQDTAATAQPAEPGLGVMVMVIDEEVVLLLTAYGRRSHCSFVVLFIIDLSTVCRGVSWSVGEGHARDGEAVAYIVS